MPTNRFERIVNKMADKINERIDTMAQGFGAGSPPPFSVKLSSQEQLQQYFAMDSDKWSALIKERGMADAKAYSEAMLKLVQQEFPDNKPSIVVAPDSAFQSGPPHPLEGAPTTAPPEAAIQAALQSVLPQQGMPPQPQQGMMP